MMNIVPSTCMSCIMFPETFYVPNYVITNGSSLVIILDVSSWICAFFLIGLLLITFNPRNERAYPGIETR